MIVSAKRKAVCRCAWRILPYCAELSPVLSLLERPVSIFLCLCTQLSWSLACSLVQGRNKDKAGLRHVFTSPLLRVQSAAGMPRSPAPAWGAQFCHPAPPCCRRGSPWPSPPLLLSFSTPNLCPPSGPSCGSFTHAAWLWVG